MAQDLRAVVRNYDRQQEEEQAAAFAALKGFSYINLVNYPFIGDVLGLIPQETAIKYKVVAFMKNGRLVRVGTTDPFQAGLDEAMNGLGTTLGVNFEPFICSQSSIDYALSRYELLVGKKQIEGVTQETREEFDQKISSLRDLKTAIEKVSTTELLDTIIAGGVSLQASDIHFEPMADTVHVRFRLDGKLLPIIDLPEKTYHLIASRIKTASHIKLDVKKVAQDGRMTITIGGKPLDIRVNAIPTAYGQTIELRLLAQHDLLTLDQLKFSTGTLEAIQQAIQKPQGLILFTGPTGSGKTTSLYAVLQLLNTPERKIVTIEDPVEYKIEGMEQVQVEPAGETMTTLSKDKGNQAVHVATATSFDFPQALRAVLRQDPDVIMVGEIRDSETAEIAVNAALTGHLVLSTLHTNSAAASFARLLQMGVPKYLLADAISLIVAQRLVRHLCTHCQGNGCENCNNTGFKGRILIVEHYIPDAKTIELIKREATVSEFDDLYAQLGYQTLLQDGLQKVQQGLTTEAEVRSVVG